MWTQLKQTSNDSFKKYNLQHELVENSFSFNVTKAQMFDSHES